MEENKSIQFEAATYTTPIQDSDSRGHDPPPPTTANDGDDEEPRTKEVPEREMETETETETFREVKRRKKNCPSALENCEALLIKSCSNSSFSFTFDPKFCSGATTPEVTPKFGSFNLVASAAAAGEIQEEKEEKKDDEKADQVNQKRKIIEVLGEFDGIESGD